MPTKSVQKMHAIVKQENCPLQARQTFLFHKKKHGTFMPCFFLMEAIPVLFEFACPNTPTHGFPVLHHR